MKTVAEEKQIRAIKIYTVEITECRSVYWYSYKTGERFTCILVSKESAKGHHTVSFAVVEYVDGKFKPPTLIRTIRPEDCRIVSEETDLYSGVNEFRKSFSKG
jgi:hypothetical protein